MLKNKNMLRFVILIFLVRVGFSLFPSFDVDMGAWLAWAYRLAELSPLGFYSDAVWTQYTPGFLYWLLVVGKLGWVDPLMIKIPVIIADIATAYLIGLIVAPKKNALKYWIYALYTLNPVVIFDGSIWGQVDGILTFAMLASTYYLIQKRNVYISYCLMGAALLIKPQAIAILPALIAYTTRYEGWRYLIKGLLVMCAVLFVGFYPFFPHNPIIGPYELISKMGESYPYTSLFAYNVWSYVGMWIDDRTILYGYSYMYWGVVMVAIAYTLLAILLVAKSRNLKNAYIVMALSCLSFFLFPTRVHERYMFPFFAFLTVSTFATNNKYLSFALLVSSILYTFNLYVPYSHYAPITNWLKNPGIEMFIGKLQPYIAGFYLLLFVGLIVWGLLPGRKDGKKTLPVRTR